MLIRIILTMVLALVLAGGVAADDAKTARAIRLNVGTLILPPDAPARADRVDLLVHFHGDVKLMTEQFQIAKLPGALVVINYNGLSAAYSKPFEDDKLLKKVMDDALATLKKEGFATDRGDWSKLRISCFSAGFGAVRQLLKHDAWLDRIDAVVAADSIYGGLEGDPVLRRVDGKGMTGFRRFAELASPQAPAGPQPRRFIVTHSQLHTPTYASTVETADDLIRHIKSQRQKPTDSQKEAQPTGMTLLSVAKCGGFEVFSYAGDDGKAHMQHLRNISHWWAMLAK